MGTVGMQGPFQPQILGGTQQLFFVEISEAASPPPPRSASYSLTHSIAWVNSDSSAQAAPPALGHTSPHTGMATAKTSLSPMFKRTLLISAPCGQSQRQG